VTLRHEHHPAQVPVLEDAGHDVLAALDDSGPHAEVDVAKRSTYTLKDYRWDSPSISAHFGGSLFERCRLRRLGELKGASKAGFPAFLDVLPEEALEHILGDPRQQAEI
jgi:hypothetical protein